MWWSAIIRNEDNEKKKNIFVNCSDNKIISKMGKDKKNDTVFRYWERFSDI